MERVSRPDDITALPDDERLRLAAHPLGLSEDEIRYLATDPNPDVRIALLGPSRYSADLVHHRLPTDVIRHLAEDANDDVTVALLSSRHTLPDDLLVRYTVHPDPRVSHATRIQVGLKTTDDWLNEYADPTVSNMARRFIAAHTTDETLLAITIADPHAVIRSAVPYNPLSTAGMMARLSSDPEPMVRSAVLANPRTPVWVIDDLTRDPDPRVRSAALERTLAAGTG